MRPKVILISFFSALIFLAAAKWYATRVETQTTGLQVTEAVRSVNDSNRTDNPQIPEGKGAFSKNSHPPQKTIVAVAAPEQVAAAAAEQLLMDRAKVMELLKLSANQDEASRSTILKELTNSSKKVREAALSAAIQINDRSVIPYLANIANHTEDAREKVAILDAIEYIKLPSLTEYREQKKKQRR